MVSPTLSPMSSPNCKRQLIVPCIGHQCGGMRWSVPSRCMTVAIVLEGQGWRRTQGSLKEGLKRTNIQQTSRTPAMQWHGSINCTMHYVHSLIVTQYIGIESSCISNDYCCQLYMHG